MPKLPPCCARPKARLIMDEANLARLARMAADAQAKNRDASRFLAKIEEAKATIAEDKRTIADHDASHAGVRA